MSGHNRKAPVSKSASKVKQNTGLGNGRAMVPRNSGTVTVSENSRPLPKAKKEVVLAPKGYTMRPVVPAKNYDVVSFARAMNDDFGPRVKRLFDPEREACMEAMKTGIYIGWRCPEYTWDCQRVSVMSKCFCGHLLGEHDKYTGISVRVPCKQAGCRCKAFSWIPSRPEDVGEFWMQRRRDFDPSTWRAKCRCKHTHEEHQPTGLRPCKSSGCSCGHFDSNFLCAACDKHWEEHETYFDTADERKRKGLPVGEEHLPFAEMPNLRNMVLTGEDDDSEYLALTQGEYAIPPSNAATGNNMPVRYNGKASQSGFRPVYD